MFRCWQWVAAWLPAPQFTWRFIYHFGRSPSERPRSGETWSPAWVLLQCFYTNCPKLGLNAPSQAGEGRRGARVRVAITLFLSSLMTNDWSHNSLSVHTSFATLFRVSLSSPCCDRHRNWLRCSPGSDTIARCLLFVDYYWFSSILHLKINSKSRWKIGAVYTYFNILLRNTGGHSFGRVGMGGGCRGGQLGGKLLTGEREAQIDSQLSSPITESGHKLKRICFVLKTAMKHGHNFLWLLLFHSLLSFTLFHHPNPPPPHTRALHSDH